MCHAGPEFLPELLHALGVASSRRNVSRAEMNSPQPPIEGAHAAPANPVVQVALSMPPALGMNIQGMALGGLPTTTQQPEAVKRKRGRPRKYVGNEPGGTPPHSAAAGVSPVNMQLALNTSSTGSPSGSPFTPTGAKRGRGRPPGSGKKYLLGASSPTSGSFTLSSPPLPACNVVWIFVPI